MKERFKLIEKVITDGRCWNKFWRESKDLFVEFPKELFKNAIIEDFDGSVLPLGSKEYDSGRVDAIRITIQNKSWNVIKKSGVDEK